MYIIVTYKRTIAQITFTIINISQRDTMANHVHHTIGLGPWCAMPL